VSRFVAGPRREPEGSDFPDSEKRPDSLMVRIFVTEEAFEPIKATLGAWPSNRRSPRASAKFGWSASGSTSSLAYAGRETPVVRLPFDSGPLDQSQNSA
jgi:hypothetical protein